jgi:hypothetical protein
MLAFNHRDTTGVIGDKQTADFYVLERGDSKVILRRAATPEQKWQISYF